MPTPSILPVRLFPVVICTDTTALTGTGHLQRGRWMPSAVWHQKTSHTRGPSC